MNRRTFDVLVPMIYAAIVVLVVLIASGGVATAIIVVGAIAVGAYYSAIRRNLPVGPDR